MKTTLAAVILIAISMTSFGFRRFAHTTEVSGSKQLAGQVIIALQKASSEDYIALFPSLNEFHAIMESSASVYGTSLGEAKQEFATAYSSRVLPSARKSFEAILRDGKGRGIDWSAIRFERVEVEQDPAATSTGAITIVFYSQGKQFRLLIEKAFVVSGQWKVSQFARLV